MSVSFTLKSLDGKQATRVEKAYSVDDLSVRSVRSIKQEAKNGRIWLIYRSVRFRELGSDVSEAHWSFKHCIGERRQPFAVKTIFGWMLCGPLTNLHNKASVNCTCIAEPSIAEQIITLYDREFTDTENPELAMSKEDKLGLDTGQSVSVWRDGHLEVPVPWRIDYNTFPNNRVLASNRLLYLKRRFDRDDPLSVADNDLWQSYLSGLHELETSCASLSITQGRDQH